MRQVMPRRRDGFFFIPLSNGREDVGMALDHVSHTGQVGKLQCAHAIRVRLVLGYCLECRQAIGGVADQPVKFIVQLLKQERVLGSGGRLLLLQVGLDEGQIFLRRNVASAAYYLDFYRSPYEPCGLQSLEGNFWYERRFLRADMKQVKISKPHESFTHRLPGYPKRFGDIDFRESRARCQLQ